MMMMMMITAGEGKACTVGTTGNQELSLEQQSHNQAKDKRCFQLIFLLKTM